MQKKYPSTKEAAEYLGVTVRTLMDWRNKKLLVPLTIAGKLFYTIELIENAMHNAD